MNGMEHKSILPILAIHENITYTVLSQMTILKDHNVNTSQIFYEI